MWTLIGAVFSGATLFASILNSSVMLGNYLQQTTSADDIFSQFFFLALLGLIANSADPDIRPHFIMSHLCLPKYLFTGIQNEKG